MIDQDEVTVYRDIPADVCSQCGKAYFSAETSLKLDEALCNTEEG